MRARPAVPDPHRLDQELPGWDYADAFEVPAQPPRPASAADAASVMFRLSPAGRRLMRLRDVLVAPAGLQSSGAVGSGVLPVVHTTQCLCVLGMDDRHLDFRVLIELDRDLVRCTTVVRRHHAGGRLYFAVVLPFHRLAVPRLLAATAEGGWPRLSGREEGDE